MATRVYEPPVDPSSTPIETEVVNADGSRRQVVRAPQVEQAVLTSQQTLAASLELIRDLLDTDLEITGTLVAANQAVTFTLPGGHSSWTAQLAGTFSAGSRVAFEGSLDNVNWYALNGRNNSTPVANETGSLTSAEPFGPGPQLWRGNCAGLKFFRARCMIFTPGDSIVLLIRTGGGVGATFQNGGLPSGLSFIGFTGSYEDIASRQGRYRFAGGKGTTSVAAPNISGTLTNPAASGVDLVVTRYSVEVDAAADVTLVYGATNPGALAVNLNPNQQTTLANPGEFRVGVDTGGTMSSVLRRAGTNSPVAVGPFRFRLPPGTSITARFLGPGATNNAYFNFGWYVVASGAELM